MAVHDKDEMTPDNNGRQSEQQQPPRASNGRFSSRGAAAQQPEQEEVIRSGNLRDFNRLFSRPLARTTAGEALQKAVTAFRRELDPATGSAVSDPRMLDFIEVLPLDAQEHNTMISAVIFTYRVEASGVLNVFTYTAALEASYQGALSQQGEYNGKRFDILQLPSDCITESFIGKVQDLVRGQYADSRREVVVHDAGWRVVASDVDFADEKSEQVRELAFFATNALTTYADDLLGTAAKFGLDWLDRNDRLDVTVSYNQRELKTADGQPKRTDVKVTLAANLADEEGPKRMALTRVGGYMSLVYSPSQQQDSFTWGRRQAETQILTPVFTINTLDTEGKAITPELLALALTSTAVLTDGARWINAFYHQDMEGENYRDVGALGYLTPLRKYAPVNTANTSVEDFMAFFTELVRPDLAIAMDIEKGGDNSWILALFLAAANGDVEAERRIYEYFDNLTLGNFSAEAKARGLGQLMAPTGNLVLLGTYRDDTGVHDLRDFDLVKWLVLRGEQDPELALDWQDTYDDTNAPIEYRIDQRLGMLTRVLGSGNVRPKALAEQILINPDAIETLAVAAHECGIVISSTNAQQQFGARRARGNQDITRFASSNVTGGLFAGWRGQQGNFRTHSQGLRGGFGTRWN